MKTSDGIISIKEAARLLNVSLATAYRLIKSGRLPAFKIGDTWRTSVKVSDKLVEELLEESGFYDIESASESRWVCQELCVSNSQ